MIITKPEASEYPRSFDRDNPTGYELYISKVAQNDLITALKKSGKEFSDFIKNIPKNKLDYRYAEGRWSIKEIAAHVIDGERVFAYRALTFARNDKNQLPGFDETLWTPESNAANRSMEALITEYTHVRNSTISLAESLSAEMSLRKGIANGKEISVRALLFVIPGHEQHHLGVIKERY
jgi:hypothetical protein